MLTASDPLPARPRRVLVAGAAGVGKSTFASELAGVLDLPYTEIDSLYHGPNWVPRPQFVEELDTLIAEETWVTEWSYRAAREKLIARADTMLWLDFPFRIALTRLVRRTVRRRARRELLWHGNVEPPLHSFFTAPDDNIVRIAVAERDKLRERVPVEAERHPELTVIRLATPHEATEWMTRLVREPPR